MGVLVKLETPESLGIREDLAGRMVGHQVPGESKNQNLMRLAPSGIRLLMSAYEVEQSF